jgi:two-component system, cell cycle response regulator
MQLLILAEHPRVRQVLHSYLTKSSFTAYTAGTIEQAEALLQRHPITILIATWPFPGAEGFRLLQRHGPGNGARHLYTLLLARSNEQAMLIKGLHAGADDYMLPPFKLPQLRRRIILGGRIVRLRSEVTQLQRELARVQDALVAARTHDPLTHVLTRGAFTEHLAALLANPEPHHKQMSLVLIELLSLPAINAQYGYAMGDQALCGVAQVVSRTVRQHDIVGRWTNTALLLALPGAAPAAAEAITTRLREQIQAARPRAPNGQPVELITRLRVGTLPMAELHSAEALNIQVERSLRPT